MLPLVAYTAIEIPRDLHNYLQQYPLTAYWYEKRMLLLEIRSKITQDHPLVPDMAPHSMFMLPDQEFVTEADFHQRSMIISKVMINKHLLHSHLSRQEHPIQIKLSRFFTPSRFKNLKQPFLKDVASRNHPLFWHKQHSSSLQSFHKLLMTPTLQRIALIQLLLKQNKDTSPHSVQHFVFQADAPPSKLSEHLSAKQKVDLELMHLRLGHQSFKSLLAASHEELWDDITLRFAPDTFCIGCKVATRRAAARGNHSVSEQTRPGQVLFMDLIHNVPRSAPIKSLQVPSFF